MMIVLEEEKRYLFGLLDNIRRTVHREESDPFLKAPRGVAKSALQSLQEAGFVSKNDKYRLSFLRERQLEDHPLGTHLWVVFLASHGPAIWNNIWIGVYAWDDHLLSGAFSIDWKFEWALVPY